MTRVLWPAGVLTLILSSTVAGSPFRLEQTSVRVRYVAYEFAIERGSDGVPRMDWGVFRKRPREIVERERQAIRIENAEFVATIIPEMGRLHSFVHKKTGREQLWINPIAVPLGATNDTRYWVTWGGIESVMPRGEHGTSHALRWEWKIEENSDRRKAVKTWVREPVSGLEHTLVYAAHPDSPALDTVITIRNGSSRPVRFSHWTTALLAPGGGGEVTAKTELIVPAERFVPDDRKFNAWMPPFIGPAVSAPIRWVQNWKDVGDLMATPLQAPYYAVYSQEKDEGVVRTFDTSRVPGFDVWCWGFPPSEKAQARFTASLPNLGYIELWNGTVTSFSDNALEEIAPGETLRWVESFFAVAGIGGDDLRAEIGRLAAVVHTGRNGRNPER